LLPYRDTVGKLTIGIGRNIEDKGITIQEAVMLLKNDIKEIGDTLSKYQWFSNLQANSPRQAIIISMAFNMGIGGLLNFRKMIQCLEAKDYTGAAEEMLNSKWAAQVPNRAKRHSEIMKSGKW
ncbi:MAG: glycoside hydrolase family protein, partial [Candidatus Competibacteraceae bacterium]|nr:glycoside hydrolase family protein [Candidatus Competibacteraceae bacterium]